MLDSEKQKFFELVASVYAFYRVDCSPFALGVWWEAFRHFDLTAVRDAFNRHAVNPDNGQWVPKPADIVKLIGGTSQDAALVAWSKVNKSIRSVGPHRSVVFDDPIIHAVITDMGGWIQLGNIEEEELPFRAKEFENRYRAFKTLGRLPDYPAHLIGYSEMNNSHVGAKIDPPVLIGDPVQAQAVLIGGGDSGLRKTLMPVTDFLKLVGDDKERAAA